MKKARNKKLRPSRMLKIAICSIIIFIVISVWYKLLFKQADWLCISSIWSVAYGLGLVIRPFIYSHENEEITNVFLFVVSIIAVGTIAAFVSGVVLSSSRWFVYLCSAAVPYAISMLVGRDFYNPEDEKYDYNEISKIEII